MVPLYLPPVVVPEEVLEEEKAIVREEGYFYIAGRYIRSATDADKVRRLEAEHRVRERERLERICAWCNFLFTAGEPTVVVGLRKIHQTPCADEFDAWAYERETARLPDDICIKCGMDREHVEKFGTHVYPDSKACYPEDKWEMDGPYGYPPPAEDHAFVRAETAALLPAFASCRSPISHLREGAREGESRVHHAAKIAQSNDPRWSLVTDDTLVDFDGEMSRWGDLMVQDRKTVDMLEDGRLVGGYPF